MRVGSVDQKRDINIGKSIEALRDAKSQALVGFRAFTGCEQTGKCNDNAKESCWNTFITCPKKVINAFMLLGNSIKHPMEECIDGIIIFFLNLYCKNQQHFKVAVAYVFKKRALIRQVTTKFSALKYTIH